MSVVLFKDGEQGVFEIHEMPYLIDNGWSTDHEGEDETEKNAVQDEPQEEINKEETPEDVRELAKDAGIEGWENKRIKTLKAELNEQQA